MPKSRQKKRDRRRGLQHQQAVQASRRMEELAEGAAHALLDRILDPSTPPHDVAELLLVTHDRAGLAPEGWGQVLARKTDPVHVRSAVAVLDEQAADSLFAVSFGVDALAPIDLAAAGDRLGEALASGRYDGHAAKLADRWTDLGRPLDALRVGQPLVRADPHDEVARQTVDNALMSCEERVVGGEGAEDRPREQACSCGSGRSWESCCGPAEETALETFADRRTLLRLVGAVQTWAAEHGDGRAVAREVTDELAQLPDSTTVGVAAAFAALMEEAAWLLPPAADAADDAADAADADQQAEVDVPSLLTLFANDAATDTELADAARRWDATVQFGLWQAIDTTASPGTYLRDLLTNTLRFVAVPAEQRAVIPAWSVLLAAVVDVDGVWRTTRDVIVLSPTEGDALAALTEDLLEVTVHGAGGGPVPPDVARAAAEPPPFGRAPEYGVMARHEPPSPPEVRRVTSAVVGSTLPRLVGELVEHRAAAAGHAKADTDADGGAPGPRPPHAHEEWMRSWVDTPSQLLGGRTPRRAAKDERWVVRLETLLRSFEWEAERAAQVLGGEPVDHTWLRQELELPPYALL